MSFCRPANLRPLLFLLCGLLSLHLGDRPGAAIAAGPLEEPPRAIETLPEDEWESAMAQRQKWWSFQPIQPQEPPASALNNSDHPLDRFIYAQLEKEGLAPASQAGRETLIRRLSFNLKGLPPTRHEIEQFLVDQ